MKTVIIGIGNTIMGDDGVGVRVAEAVSKKTNLKFIEMNTTGVDVVENMLGYDCAVIIDAVFDDGREEGEVVEYGIDEYELANFSHKACSSSIHEMSLPTALKIGKIHFPKEIPKKVLIFGIVIKDIQEFREDLSENIKRKIDDICDDIIKRMGVHGCP